MNGQPAAWIFLAIPEPIRPKPICAIVCSLMFIEDSNLRILAALAGLNRMPARPHSVTVLTARLEKRGVYRIHRYVAWGPTKGQNGTEGLCQTSCAESIRSGWFLTRPKWKSSFNWTKTSRYKYKDGRRAAVPPELQFVFVGAAMPFWTRSGTNPRLGNSRKGQECPKGSPMHLAGPKSADVSL